MNRNTAYNISFLLAVLAGATCYFFPIPFVLTLANTISELFLNMLKLISLPMIFLAIVSTLTQMKNLKEAGWLLKKILKYTLITTLISAAIGLILFTALKPNHPATTIEPLTPYNSI